MVQPETTRWLNESRGSFGAAQRRFHDISSMDVTGAAALFKSTEYAVKAVIAEHYGFLPPRFESHRIVNLSHQIGLWSQLPPDLRAYLADMAHLDPNVRRPPPTVSAGREPRNFAPLDPDVRDPRETTYEAVVASSSNAEWQQRLTTALRFIQYLERDVIGNPAAFGKLTF
jgi:hypothetical protein